MPKTESELIDECEACGCGFVSFGVCGAGEDPTSCEIRKQLLRSKRSLKQRVRCCA